MCIRDRDYKEIDKVIMTAIETSTLIVDSTFEPSLIELAKNDQSLTVRDLAIKALKRSYDRTI